MFSIQEYDTIIDRTISHSQTNWDHNGYLAAENNDELSGTFAKADIF